MSGQFVYMPVLRVRQEERKILRRFNFGASIFPCVEIIREHESIRERHTKKTFAETYLPLLREIKSHKVFVDLPVHFKEKRKTEKPVLDFVTNVIDDRSKRTQYMWELTPVADKIIPVISTYFLRKGEPNSIVLQERELRPTFKTLAFRTFENSIANDIEQVKLVAEPNDFLIVDLEEYLPNPEGDEIIEFAIEKLAGFNKCPIIILGSAIPHDITNIGLEHGEVISRADNKLLSIYKTLKGQHFGDYMGIKKDDVTEGGAISPGFIFYDPVENRYYGFRGQDKPVIQDFANIIVPAVYDSPTADRMQQSGLLYLVDNVGWQMLCDIKFKGESGESQAKFKGITMEHYLHCIKTKINAGHFAR